MCSPKTLSILVLSGLILGFNWGLFIWAVNNDHLLEASLGYFINPLFNVLFGFVFLGERFRRLQQIAVGMAVSVWQYLSLRLERSQLSLCHLPHPLVFTA